MEYKVKKHIVVPEGVRGDIMATFNTNAMAVSRALNFEINSNKARMLRAAAMERGGVLVDGGKAYVMSREAISGLIIK